MWSAIAVTPGEPWPNVKSSSNQAAPAEVPKLMGEASGPALVLGCESSLQDEDLRGKRGRAERLDGQMLHGAT